MLCEVKQKRMADDELMPDQSGEVHHFQVVMHTAVFSY